MKRIMYKGYEIQAVPHLSESRKWKVNVFICDYEKSGVMLHNFVADDLLCDTLEEAENVSLAYGKSLIDQRGAAQAQYRKFKELVK